MTHNKILVPVDFSECSRNALRFAIKFASKFQSEILIFHAYQLPIVEGQYGAESLADKIALEEKVAIDEQFRILKKNVPELSEVSYEILSKPGHVEYEILALSESANIDLVIMGTLGVSGLDEIIVGSNAYSVIKKVNIPVLLIPGETKLKSITRIAFAGDYKPIEEKVLEPLKLFAKIFNAEIHIIHVNEIKLLKEEEAEQAKKFETYFRNFKHRYQLVVNESIEKGILGYCTEKNIDLLAIAPRKQQLFDIMFGRSETKKVVFHSKIPVLTLPG